MLGCILALLGLSYSVAGRWVVKSRVFFNVRVSPLFLGERRSQHK